MNDSSQETANTRFSPSGAVLIEQLFPSFFFFFLQENRKNRKKQETFPDFGNLTEGKISGTLSIPIFKKKMENLDFFLFLLKSLDI